MATLLVRGTVVTNFTAAIKLLGGSGGSKLKYTFNGTDSYATIPDWKPLGRPYEVSFEAVPQRVDGTQQYMLQARVAGNAHAASISGSNFFQQVYKDTADGNVFMPVNGSAVQKEAILHRFIANADETIHDVNGNQITGVVAQSAGGSGVLGNVAASAVPNGYFAGPIWNLRLTDNSVIQDTDVRSGATGSIPAIDMSNATVELNCVLGADGDILTGFLSKVAGVLTLSANAANLVVDGVAYTGWPVAVGEHVSISFTTSGGTLTSMVTGGGIQDLIINADESGGGPEPQMPVLGKVGKTEEESLTAVTCQLSQGAVAGRRLGLLIGIRTTLEDVISVDWGGATVPPLIQIGGSSSQLPLMQYYEITAGGDANDVATLTLPVARRTKMMMWEIENWDSTVISSGNVAEPGATINTGAASPTVDVSLALALHENRNQQEWTTGADYAGVSWSNGFALWDSNAPADSNRPIIGVATKALADQASQNCEISTVQGGGDACAALVIYNGASA